ncbi:CU044_2847 family protein [Streptomyces aureus]|uniref:CU044_2847 family protein n=1 Tax=Streptomyces aureus TaxID=193461 RepID=UPI0033CABE44
MVAEVDLADVVDLGDDVELVAEGGPGRSAQALQSLAEAFDGLEPALATIVTRLRRAARGPDMVTLEFGLKFGGETGVIFARGSAEAALAVTIAWDRGMRDSGEGESEPSNAS